MKLLFLLTSLIPLFYNEEHNPSIMEYPLDDKQY